VDWLYACHADRKPQPYNWKLSTPTYKSNPFVRHPHKVWILADRLLATEYSKVVLAMFIQGIHLIKPDTLVSIVEQALPTSALYLFTFAWIAFARYHKWKISKNLNKYKHMDLVALDPRRYEVEHWYSECAREAFSSTHCRTGLAALVLAIAPQLKCNHATFQVPPPPPPAANGALKT
jgi:hypothetical protein